MLTNFQNRIKSAQKVLECFKRDSFYNKPNWNVLFAKFHCIARISEQPFYLTIATRHKALFYFSSFLTQLWIMPESGKIWFINKGAILHTIGISNTVSQFYKLCTGLSSITSSFRLDDILLEDRLPGPWASARRVPKQHLWYWGTIVALLYFTMLVNYPIITSLLFLLFFITTRPSLPKCPID